MKARDYGEFGYQIRPWVRFWARSIDLCVCGSVFGLMWAAIGPPVNTKYAAICILYAFLWVPVETLLLSTWGTTPGKWLMRTTLRDSTGNKLKFSAVLSRSLYVWAWGLGIGFPYAMLVAESFAYLDLQNKGMTRWDRKGHFRISHQQIGMHRVIVTIVLMVGLIAIFELSTDLITAPGSSFSMMGMVAGVGILLIISLASLVSIMEEDREQSARGETTEDRRPVR